MKLEQRLKSIEGESRARSRGEMQRSRSGKPGKSTLTLNTTSLTDLNVTNLTIGSKDNQQCNKKHMEWSVPLLTQNFQTFTTN